MLIETNRFVLLLIVLLLVKMWVIVATYIVLYIDIFDLDTHIPSTIINSLSLSLARSLALGAVFGQTVARSDRQDGVVATSAVGTQDRDAQRLRLHSRTAHTLLLHSRPLQGVHGLTATFALTDRRTDGQAPQGRGRKVETVRDSVMISLNFVG